MSQILELFQNHVLLVGCCGWLAAQVLKMVLHGLIHHTFDISRLFGLGGMPSSHTSFLTAASMAIGFQEGFHTAIFGLAVCMTLVVMTDAAGVRRAAGKHAMVLNRIIADMIHEGKGIDEERLKELIGHTPVQVLAGALLGVIVGVVLG